MTFLQGNLSLWSPLSSFDPFLPRAVPEEGCHHTAAAAPLAAFPLFQYRPPCADYPAATGTSDSKTVCPTPGWSRDYDNITRRQQATLWLTSKSILILLFLCATLADEDPPPQAVSHGIRGRPLARLWCPSPPLSRRRIFAFGCHRRRAGPRPRSRPPCALWVHNRCAVSAAALALARLRAPPLGRVRSRARLAPSAGRPAPPRAEPLNCPSLPYLGR